MSGSHQVEYDGSEIAICAMAGRFPGAPDVPTFWRNLREGVESISSFTRDEVLAAGEEPELVDSPNYVMARGVVEGAERFDAGFFGLTPREAEVLDPQERLLLECVWEALELAGYDTQRTEGRIGLFAGAPLSTYLAHQLYRNRPVMKAFGDVESTVYNSPGTVATFAAYKLNLRGACCSVQTFCSTSLVAVHLACQSLLNFENDVAVAGGVTVFAPQQRGYFFQAGGIVSPDGKCRVFDAEAAGTVFGNGVGAVVLKRLKDALADRDTIHAVIRGSAINNDGALKVSYAAPSVGGQTDVIVEALGAAGIDPGTIGYVETHGTGTRLGDPAEIEALTKAFRTGTQKKQFCAIGSVKSNVGHLDAAAGVAGLIKTVLCLKHGEIPATLRCEQLNPLIDFANSPFYVNTRLAEWKNGPGPRRAAVSAFGIGGTNAHVVLEEAPPPAADDPSRSSQLLVLSAKTRDALEEASRRLSAFLRENPRSSLADVAYTLQVGRRQFNHRRVVVAESAAAAAQALESDGAALAPAAESNRRNPPVVFLLPDEAVLENVGRELYEREPAFRREVDAIAELARRLFGLDLIAILYPDRPERPAAAIEGFPGTLALFAVEYALARLWLSWGVKPEALAGSGPGDWVAACLAGVCSLEDALQLLARAGGARTAAAQTVQPRLGSPRVRLLSASSASPLADDEAALLGRLSAPPAPGKRLREALASLPADTGRVVVEMGAGSERHGVTALASVPPAGEGGEQAHVLRTLGALWLAGLEVDWRAFHGTERRRRVPLPTYPFERRRYWVEAIPEEPAGKPGSPKHSDTDRWLYSPVWRSSLAPVPDTQQRRSCLVFTDRAGVAAGLVDLLRQSGREVVTVSAGEVDGGSLAGGYVLNPRSESGYDGLLADLTRAGKLPDTIVHAWLVDPIDDAVPGGGVELGSGFDRGFFSLLQLARALARLPESHRVHLTIVSSQVHDVAGREPLCPSKAAPLALCRVIQQEHQNVRCSAVDIELAAGQKVEPSLHDALLAEVLGDGSDPVVAYRWDRRWTLGYDGVTRQPDLPARRLRQQGVYVVTGGLGNVGLVVAACLASWAQARIALIARSRLPARSEWAEWLASHDRREATSMRIRVLQAIEAAGGEALALQADVTDLEQMRSAFAEARARFGQIDGVFHCAGVVSSDTFAPIQRLTPEICRAQFAPKVRGLDVLHTLLADAPPDFCVLASSLSSVLGGLGYGAYAAANMYMDAFAAARNREGGTPWIAIDWDQWRFAGRPDGGLASGSTLEALAMQPHEGAAVLERVLRYSQPRHFVVSTGSLDARIATWVRMADVPGPERKRRPAEIERIETAIASHPSVKEAAVVAEGGPGERRFIAHVLFEPGASLTTSELRRFARERLAAAEVPSFFVTLDAGQVGPDGRIDRQALSGGSDEGSATPDDASAPRTAAERRIAAMWQDVLGVETVRVHDNFFDIGGHSLLSVRVIAKIESAFGLRLDYRTMFLENLEQIAARCDRHAAGLPAPAAEADAAEVGSR